MDEADWMAQVGESRHAGEQKSKKNSETERQDKDELKNNN
jgi:hypothetical protein